MMLADTDLHNLGSVTSEERDTILRALLDYVNDLAKCVTAQYDQAWQNGTGSFALGAADTAAHARNVGAAGTLLARLAEDALRDEKRTRAADPANQPLNDLPGLSNRARRALSNNGIRTVGKLLDALRNGSASSIAGIGPTTVREITNALDEQGLMKQ